MSNYPPNVVAGVKFFDGKGNLTQRDYGGDNVPAEFAPPGQERGTYSVNPDCTGTYTVKDSSGDTFDAFFVISDGGNQLRIVITDPGTVITCIARKQFPDRREHR